MSIYLIACLWLDGALKPVYVLNDRPYTSYEQCRDIRDNPIVRADYKSLIGEDTVFVCSRKR